METAATLKSELINKIKNSQDLDFLKTLKAIVDNSEKDLYMLGEKQQKAIHIGREQIKNGEFFDNSQVLAESREWLKKK